MDDNERDTLLLKMDASIDEMKQTDSKIVAVLFDTNGHKGICSQVAANTHQISRLWVAVIVVAGSAGGGIAIAEVVKALSGT